ncbi:MAG TPA: hypothetical protein VJ655_08825, partial [Caulobacter sp.]|nr:hypothetical protein [Caulobacter sp.]
SPLRKTLVMEGGSFKEGVFAWKGLLYYKWMLTTLWPRLTDVSAQIGRLEVNGDRDGEDGRYLDEARRRLQGGLLVERHAILRTLKVYDDAFEHLVDHNQPHMFRQFLLRAPELFVSLGERVGAVAHIATYWRYRFPAGRPLTADLDEAVDIFQDFEASLAMPLSN